MCLDEIREAIAKTIRRDFYSPVIFCTPFTVEDLTDCIIMELIKPAFEATMKKKSIRSHFRDYGYDPDSPSDRMRFSRRLSYAQAYRSRQNEMLVSQYGYGHPALEPEDMETMEDKLTGHGLTAMQFFELVTMDKLPLLQNVVNKRLADTHKVSNDSFRKMFAEYDAYVSEFKAKATDDFTTVFYTYALYTLEWRYSLDLLYRCVEAAETFPGADAFCAATLLAGGLGLFPDNFGMPVTTENRFILHRTKLLPQALDESSRPVLRAVIYGCNRIKFLIKRDRQVAAVVAENTSLAEWADFMRRRYPLLDRPMLHEWPNNRIRAYRKLVSQMFLDSPKPPKK